MILFGAWTSPAMFPKDIKKKNDAWPEVAPSAAAGNSLRGHWAGWQKRAPGTEDSLI